MENVPKTELTTNIQCQNQWSIMSTSYLTRFSQRNKFKPGYVGIWVPVISNWPFPYVFIKFVYSEKATKILRNLQLFVCMYCRQKKVEIRQNFCGLLRIYELYQIGKWEWTCWDYCNIKINYVNIIPNTNMFLTKT